jgi:alginate O-acetyltransferase complex protein AlgI
MNDFPSLLRAAFEPAGADEAGRIFNTYWFVVFAAVTTAGYWLLRKPALRLSFLAVACVIFHFHFAGPAGMLPIIVLGIITYVIGLTRNRHACVVGIALSVLALCFYKYAHFLTLEVLGMVNKEWGTALEAQARAQLPTMVAPAGGTFLFIPPLGMSFFAFEFVHYLYEVRKGAAPLRNPLYFTLFSIFFPALVAGPIKRFGQFIPSLQSGARQLGAEDLAVGFRRIAMGFLKKVVIADNLTLALNHYATTFDGLDLVTRWFLLILIALRILLDFSGYSDIAIGLARLLGVQLPENFNWPYAARSIQDFWQRWHISLSSWIRDYVYIPLGGNRHGMVRKIFNGLLAFALCGLWHGPAWNFVVWGLYHGTGLAICSNYRALPGFGKLFGWLFEKFPSVAWLLTQLFVCLGWLLFFYPLDKALLMSAQLFGFAK